MSLVACALLLGRTRASRRRAAGPHSAAQPRLRLCLSRGWPPPTFDCLWLRRPSDGCKCAERSVSHIRAHAALRGLEWSRSEEHTSELQSLMRISYAVFCLKKKKHPKYYRYKRSTL